MGGNVEVVDALNALLRGELSAIGTYRQALAHLPPSFPARGALEACLRSHEDRALALRREIVVRGGEAVMSGGAWGRFVRFIETTAEAFGPRMAIAALEEGEHHGLRAYAASVERLDAGARSRVMDELLPAQQQTWARMSTVQATLAPPA